ncbi:MAG: hypothetical protein WDO14_00795 [Bacteroidota bacterium]
MADQMIYFGKLSLLYENGFVRYIRSGENEIVRNIYFALRDNNWTTAPFVRSDERISVTPKYFEITYTATNVVEGTEVFRWRVKITGNDSGEVDFAVDGECLAPYNRNRAGICVLHPVRDTRDKPLHITRPDGSRYETKFPSAISPYQPFFEIRKMTWPVVGDAWAELQFEGDIFETEDQRNWADFSFKTYSTPLAVPYPVMLKPGDKVNQRVRLSLINGDSLAAPDVSEDLEVTIDESDSKPFPKIGADYELNNGALSSLKELHFDHLRIELDLSSSWKDKLEAGLREAENVSAKPFIHLVMDSASEFKEFASMDHLMAISPTNRKANVDILLTSISIDKKIGAGFISYFTELNRNRFDYSKLGFVIYPVTPQAHLSDVHTAIENLPAQKDQLESGKHFVDGKKIHVGPVSLLSSVPDRVAAGWMLGSIKYLSEGGADRITMFDTNYYLSNPTVYNTLLALVKLSPTKVISSSCNEPLAITSLVIESPGGRHLVLANHTSSRKFVTVHDKLYPLSEYEVKFIPLQ